MPPNISCSAGDEYMLHVLSNPAAGEKFLYRFERDHDIERKRAVLEVV
jgi:hypothetical protein